MAGGFRVVVLVLLLLAGCGRGDDEIAALRQSVEAEMTGVPLPEGASLSGAEFDQGCLGFAECADGPNRPAELKAGLHLAPSRWSLCESFVEMLDGKGHELVGYLDRSAFRVDAAACAAGHPGNGRVMRKGGLSFSDRASLELTLEPSPAYRLAYEAEAPADVRTLALTASQVAHIRGTLDRPFVLRADPPLDGIGDRDIGLTWSVPRATTSVRFEVTCDARDVVELYARAPSSSSRERHTAQCTGAATELELPVGLEKDEISVEVQAYGRTTPGAQPKPFGAYVVRFVSRS